MTTEFKDAKRANVPLLILLAGGTGSGKTESALRLATGLAGGQPFAVIDTESGRALHKADDYRFKHADLDEPFTPERYAEKVKDAAAAGFPVIVIDSGSHEYEGIGGVLEIQQQEFERMGGRESARMSSWIQPKQRHKRFVQQLLRTPAHVILCLRAEDKVEVVKENGKTVVRPKQSLTGAEGWIPICEKRLPFEATISLLLTADAPGFPKPIKLERRHRELVALDAQLDEETGRRLAVWAAGGTVPASSAAPGPTTDPSSGAAPEGNDGDTGAAAITALETKLRGLLEQAGTEDIDGALARGRANKSRGAYRTWLERQLPRAREAADGKGSEGATVEPPPPAPGADAAPTAEAAPSEQTEFSFAGAAEQAQQRRRQRDGGE